MAVIVTDMQMPFSCETCEYRLIINNAEVGCMRHPMERPVGFGWGRPNHCPLAEVNMENMTNQKLLAKMPPEKCVDTIFWLVQNYGKQWTDSRYGIMQWLIQEADKRS